jgi:hypothetical protein
MKKAVFIGLILFFVSSAFSAHKFYVSIYQINFAPEKKMLQITSRIFIDDLNKALEKKYSQKTHVGEPNETQEDFILMNKYLLEKFSIKVNGAPKPLLFVSKELENNVVICYYKINNLSKITSLEVKNTALLELDSNQQNIIQANFNGKKQSLLLTNENTTGLLK